MYKGKLFALRDELFSQVKDLSENNLMRSQKDMSGDISGHSLHMADVAGDFYEREFNLGLMSNEKRTIFEIDAALKRIEDKSYGTCSMCEEPIAKIRLNAIPYARYCKKCQEKLEKEEQR